MVRPRLVEEGVPIYGPGSDGRPHRVAIPDDQEMDDHHHDHHTTPNSTEPKQQQALSSLQLAALSTGTVLPGRKRQSRICTTYEVGSGTGSMWEDTSAMDHPHSKSSWHTDIHQHHHQISQPYNSVQHDAATIDGRHPISPGMELDFDYSNGARSAVGHPGHDVKDYHSRTHKTMNYHSYSMHHATQPMIQTSCTIGELGEAPEKMVGVEDHGHKAPLVVLDGANVAHAYGTALAGLYMKGGGVTDPDATGIQVAVDYFQSAGIRVLVVLPLYWFGSRSHYGSTQWNVKQGPQHEVLTALQAKGLIVASPPADDDDAYALTIARREESRSLQRHGEGPGFVLSNDMFRDAQERDMTNALRHWLTNGRNATTGPGRISYSFADMGTMNDHGERILDFVPNPRHPLIIWIEGMNLQRAP